MSNGRGDGMSRMKPTADNSVSLPSAVEKLEAQSIMEMIYADPEEKKKHIVHSKTELGIMLSVLSVKQVTEFLNRIKSDRRITNTLKRRAIAEVVTHQPHPVSKFSEFDKYNKDIRESRDIPYLVGGYGFMWASFFFLLSGVSALISEDALSFVEVNAYASFGLMLTLGILSPVMFAASYQNNVYTYGNRSYTTLEAHEKNLYGKKAVNTIQESFAESDAHAPLEESPAIAPSEPRRSYVSAARALSEYESAVQRIGSYELDFDKALRYPAFNDITVKETRDMIRQLRKCRNMSENVNTQDAADFMDEVDELWVCIQTAEKMAERISWDRVSEEEKRNLDKAQKIFVQANDPGNSDIMRANLYAKLKSVVDQLNQREKIVPAKIIEQIEAKAAQQIEAA